MASLVFHKKMGICLNTANDNWGSIVVKIKAGVKADINRHWLIRVTNYL